MQEELRAKIAELQEKLEAMGGLRERYKQVWDIETTENWGTAEALAGEGWELVSVTVNPGRDYGVIHTYFFKRQTWVERG